MPPTVLLASTVSWPTAARLAGSLARAGCTVVGLVPRGDLFAASRYAGRTYLYAPLRQHRSLLEAITKARPDIVVPCDDRAVRLMIASWREARETGDAPLVALIARSLGNPAAYDEMMSRQDFMSAARAEGLHAPEMQLITSRARLEEILSRTGYPVVMKTDGTWGGDGVRIVHSEKEALAAWRTLGQVIPPLRCLYRAVARRDAHHLLGAFSASKPIVNLQPFVAGTPATSSFACWEGRVIASVHFDVVVAREETGPALVLRRIEDGDMEKAAVQIASRFRLSGLHGLDFMRDRDGRACLIESNPRATPTSHLAELVPALARALGAEPRERTANHAIGRSIALFPQAWIGDPAGALLREAHVDIPWDDPPLLRAMVARARFPSPAPVRNGDLPAFGAIEPGNDLRAATKA